MSKPVVGNAETLRKNVGAYSAPFEYTAPTEEQINKAWEEHLERMSHGGTYGDNMEIRAFAKAFNVDVKIYNHGNSYYVKAEEHGTRPVVHIAYHVSTRLQNYIPGSWHMIQLLNFH